MLLLLLELLCCKRLGIGKELIHVSLDLSGRPYLGYDLQIPTQRVGTYDTRLAGRNSHHIIEATFKAFARALRQATDMIHVIFGLCHGKRKEQQGRCEFVKNKLLSS
ncbi:hypothetical protein OIU78_007208 [Salix suchowensis]|nr:hypothetical protein OIU78_007208 [Salix suchowensis]